MKNFKIRPQGELSKELLNKGFTDFLSVAEWVKALPYQRISDKSNLGLTIAEHRGTCSSKHAFLKAVLNEQDISDVTLHIGMFKMQEANTKGIGDILKTHKLEYIPEAHCYLKYQNQRFDYTMPTLNLAKIEAVLIEEIEIQPEQVSTFKTEYHQTFIKKWINRHQVPKTLEEVWLVREACIARLSEV
jgi:hypothetical protein